MAVIAIGNQPVFSYFPAHSHDVWEIVLNLEGQGKMGVGKIEYDFQPGTIICLPPNVPHVKSADDVFRDVYIQSSTFSLGGAGKPLVFQDDAEKSFESLLLMANRVYHKKENNYRQVLEALFESLEQLLISWYAHSKEDLIIEQLKNKMVNAFTDPEFTVSDLMVGNHYCIDHLRRLFKQATGQTPLEYLTELRLNYAKKIMRENRVLHYSISEIAAMSGFYDSGYFSRIFKKWTGISPSEYAKQAAERTSLK